MSQTNHVKMCVHGAPPGGSHWFANDGRLSPGCLKHCVMKCESLSAFEAKEPRADMPPPPPPSIYCAQLRIIVSCILHVRIIERHISDHRKVIIIPRPVRKKQLLPLSSKGHIEAWVKRSLTSPRTLGYRGQESIERHRRHSVG